MDIPCCNLVDWRKSFNISSTCSSTDLRGVFWLFVAVVLLLLSLDESTLLSVSMGPEEDDWEGCCGGDVEAAMLVVGASLAVAGAGFLARLNRALGAFLGGAAVVVVVLVVATVGTELGVSVDDKGVGEDAAVKTADKSCIL